MPVYLTIKDDRKMKWNVKKDDVGSQRFRHRAATLARVHSEKLPVTVVIRRLPKHLNREFTIRPMLVNGSARNVFIYHKNVMMIMQFEDAAAWIKSFIISGKLYEQPRFQMAV